MTALFSVILFFVYVLLPASFLVRSWKDQSNDFLKWVGFTLFSAGYILFLFVVGGWPMLVTGYYLRYVILAALLIVTIKSYFNTKRKFYKGTIGYYLKSSLSPICGLFSLGCSAAILMSSFSVQNAVEIDFPLKDGSYYILQGGNNSLINHHRCVSAQKYAIDVLKLNRWGGRHGSLRFNHKESSNIFGDIIYSPCDGIVVQKIDEYPDLELGKMDPAHPAGNHLAIEMDAGKMTLLLAHMQKGSFLVEEGEVIKKGQPLGRVGNSGNTSEPHLHIHVVKSGEDLLFKGEGIPVKFNKRFLVRNSLISIRHSKA